MKEVKTKEKDEEKSIVTEEAAPLFVVPKIGQTVVFRKGYRALPLLVTEVDKKSGILSGVMFDARISGGLESKQGVKPGTNQGEWWSDEEVLRATIDLEINRKS